MGYFCQFLHVFLLRPAHLYFTFKNIYLAFFMTFYNGFKRLCSQGLIFFSFILFFVIYFIPVITLKHFARILYLLYLHLTIFIFTPSIFFTFVPFWYPLIYIDQVLIRFCFTSVFHYCHVFIPIHLSYNINHYIFRVSLFLFLRYDALNNIICLSVN